MNIQSLPPYIWRDPNSDGWVDAWNGWYPTLREALDQASGGVSTPTSLAHGEGLITADEQERRLAASR